MKKIRNVLLGLMVFFLLLSPVPTSADENSAVYGESYITIMKVHKDGSIDVDVEYNVIFNEERQGIFIMLPQAYEMTFDLNGDKVNRRYLFPISNIESESHTIDIDHSRKGVVVKMGKEGVYLTGLNTFKLSYKVQTTDLNLKGKQMFYMNMFPTNSDFEVGRLEFNIQFYDNLSGNYYMYPPTGEVIKNQFENGSIVDSYEEGLFNNTVTVEVPLTEGYFEFPSINYVKPAFFLGVLAAIIAVFIYLLFGKDPVVIETVEFTAPEGLSSAEIGYVYRGLTNSKDVVSLIVYWASKGFIRIHELQNEEVALEKIQDLPAEWNVEEIRLFKKVFESGDYVEMKSLNTKIGETVLHLQAAIPRRFTQNPALRIYDRKSSMMKLLSIFIIPLIPAMMGYSVVLLKTAYKTDALVAFSVGYGIFLIISIAGSSLLAFDRVYKKSQRITYALIVVTITVLVGFGLAITFGAKDHKAFVLSTLLVFSVALFFVANTSRRTQKGADWVGQVRGLKRFIEVAEKDRLIALVKETPYIFYDILPYAYVLGVTDIWINKFESIAIQAPDWYVSSNPNLTTYWMMRSLSRSMNGVSTSLTSIPVATSGKGGGSFGGGGGGGGFSGGGFGGGSSGSW